MHPKQEIEVPKELFMKLSEIQAVPFKLMVKEWRNAATGIKHSDKEHPLIKVIEKEIRGIKKVTQNVTINLNQNQINTVEEYL